MTVSMEALLVGKLVFKFKKPLDVSGTSVLTISSVEYSGHVLKILPSQYYTLQESSQTSYTCELVFKN
jgi:hypothetical protein